MNQIIIKKNKKLEFKLFASDLFRTASPEYYYISNGVKQIYQNYFDSRGIRFSLLYKLGNFYNRSINIPQSSSYDERERL